MPGQVDRLPRLGAPAAGIEALLATSRIFRTGDHQHARLFILSHLFGPLIGLALCAFLVRLGAPADYRLTIFALLVGLFWAYPLLLARGVDYNWLCLASLQHLLIVIFWVSLGYGGLNSPFLLWLVVVPLLGCLYLAPGTRLWPALLGLLALNGALFLAGLAILPAPPPLDPQAAGALGLLSMLCASAYVAMMATWFGLVLSSRADVEGEIAQHRATAAALAEAAGEARAAGLAKVDFVAQMSHELRAPLNAILGYAQLLLDDAGRGEDGFVTDLESINGAGRYLLTLVDDILDLARLDAGQLAIAPVAVDPAAIVARVAAQIAPAAEQRRNRIVTELPDRPLFAVADPALLEKAVLLVARHCAHSAMEGRVTLRVVAAPASVDDPKGDMVRAGAGNAKAGGAGQGQGILIEIADDGPPIPPARLESLFDSLGDLKDAGASKYGGHGLGLALAQRLCGLMGMRIEAESSKARGTRFAILLAAG